LENFFIGKSDFRVWLPDVEFSFDDDVSLEKSGDNYDSRKIKGIMSTSSLDRQGEEVIAKGLDFNPFLQHGHFNDNHSQSTAAVVGYPERAYYSKEIQKSGKKTDGWITEGYVIKGTQRADQIWELAKALAKTPDRRLGFSIEGKVTRRKNKVIEKALIRNVAITNCPVNTDCTWDTLAKSFYDEDLAIKSFNNEFGKALSCGHGAAEGPAAQTNGSALSPEALDSDDKKKKKKDKGLKIVMRSLGYDPDEVLKAFDWIQECRPDFYTDEAAAEIVKYLLKKKG